LRGRAKAVSIRMWVTALMTRPASTNDIVVEDKDNEMLSIVLACAGVSVDQTLLYVLYKKVVSKIVSS
jgi:hypothetical protein